LTGKGLFTKGGKATLLRILPKKKAQNFIVLGMYNFEQQQQKNSNIRRRQPKI
jgi:hypothetical protein